MASGRLRSGFQPVSLKVKRTEGERPDATVGHLNMSTAALEGGTRLPRITPVESHPVTLLYGEQTSGPDPSMARPPPPQLCLWVRNFLLQFSTRQGSRSGKLTPHRCQHSSVGQVHCLSAQRLPGAIFCVLKAEPTLKNRNLILFIIFFAVFHFNI